MLDAKFVRANADLVKEVLKKRNYTFDFDAFCQLDEQRRELLKKIEDLSARQNKASSQMQALIKEKKDPKVKIEECKEIKRELDVYTADFKEIEKEWVNQSFNLPNLPHSSVPVGDEYCNKIVQTCGELKEFDFTPASHIDIAERLDIIDFKRAAKLTGSNFVLFKGVGARLERALINFMLDLHTKEHGYREISPQVLVNRSSMVTTGQLPKFEEDMYKLKDEDYFLIPTAEVPLTNIHRDEVLEEDCLPVYYTAYTTCFRREAGSYGKDTRGLVRVHQFDKVELVKFVKPESSYDELEKLLKNACRVIELLEIPYRIVLLSTQELSFAAAKCYDIEIYAPGIDKWLEVASCSNFEDFQARRGNIRYRDKQTRKIRFVHTLNGSGVALARLVAAILENCQEKDGSISVPSVLRGYMDGRERIVGTGL